MTEHVYREGDSVTVVTQDGAEFRGVITNADDNYFTLSGCPPELGWLLDDGIPVQNYGFCYEDVELRPA